MASTSNEANSRLKQLQMRFQQKQKEERDLKRMEISEATSETTKPVGNGKVRQMFDERRRGAGIDRSNPLKPIASGAAKSKFSKSLHSLRSTSPTTPNDNYKIAAKRSTPLTRPITNNNKSPTHTLTNGNGQTRRPMSRAESDELDNIANETLPKGFSSISLYERTNGDSNNNNRSKVRTDPYSRTAQSIKLNPVVTKKSPPVLANRTAASTMTRKSPATLKSTVTPTSPRAGKPIAVRTTNGTAAKNPMSPTKSAQSGVRTMPRDLRTKLSAASGKSSVPDGTTPCKFCGRNFLSDRLEKHEQICHKTINKQRKLFDASKHRVKGTDAEKYVKRPTRAGVSSTAARNSTVAQASAKKNNWRQKHEDFITAIRAAKELQAHLAKGGKLSDLPPPPPSLNPDYIECPHCSRRFNEAAASRHIPKCLNMRHNKPKPGQPVAARKR